MARPGLDEEKCSAGALPFDIVIKTEESERKVNEKTYKRETEILHRGGKLTGRIDIPETPPIYMTTAFNCEDLDDLRGLYADGYGYNRSKNPNRNLLGELISYLEGGESSLICSSGMGAISTAVLSTLKSGDHILADQSLYGESIMLFEQVLPNYGIESTMVDFTDLEKVKNAVKPNTKIIYVETVANPMISVVDIDAAAEIAHGAGAILMVDNTFTTSLVIKPLEHGADVVVNSLTKFVNGHSDVVAGSITASKEFVAKAKSLQALLGCSLDAFNSWLVQRGARTMDLRVQRQLDNAEKLARALEANPHVVKVNHPSLESHPQHELAKRLFKNGYTGMLSFVMPDDRDKINEFMRRLNFVKYAMTLGGLKTTLAHPVSSSHSGVPEEERLKMGVTGGLMRVSVGLENPDDLIADFNQALEVFA